MFFFQIKTKKTDQVRNDLDLYKNIFPYRLPHYEQSAF